MKEHELHTLWQVPKYLPYIQPQLTDEALANAEELIGYKFPLKYIELIKIQNGGYIRFAGLNGLNRTISGIGPYYPSITQFDWSDYAEYVSFELNGLIPFDGDGHWYLCLDYRKNKVEPQITFISTESDTEEVIADSFDQYLYSLQLDTGDIYVIEGDHRIEQIVNQLQGTLNVSFIGPDHFAHGYPIYQFERNGHSVWISPNEVPRGFVRPEDERFEELWKEMEGYALQYPEIPAGSVFIQFADDQERVSICKTLTDHSFKISALKDMF